MSEKVELLLQELIDAVHQNTAEVTRLVTLVEATNAKADAKVQASQEHFDNLTKVFPILKTVLGGTQDGQ